MGKRLRVSLIGLLFLLVTLIPATLQAAPAGQGLEISPPLLDLKADPGQQLTADIKVRNVTADTLVVKAAFTDFLAAGEEGQPKLLLAPGDTSPYSLKDWLAAPQSLRLASGQQQTVKVTISVPKDASPGGHYGVVRFTGSPPELEGSGVSLSASVGTLLLVNVSGNVQVSAKVAELYTSQDGHRHGFFEYGPVDITTRIQNTGNSHIKPKGTLQVTNMFGKNVMVAQFNQTGHNVLPGSIRRFEQQLDKKLLFGRYTVKADVVYGTDNKIASRTVTFWAIPYKLIILAILAIVLLVIGAKRYNKYIVKRSKRKSK